MVANLTGTEFALDIVARLLCASFAGAIVGYERKMRQKEAGIRTHCFVALGAAIFTILSQYGSVNAQMITGNSFDLSRIAANIVNGVSFLGAGIIFVKNKTISGLTTAAGIWAVSAIGMAFGYGMFNLGIVSLLIIVLMQYVLHKPLIRLEGSAINEYTCIIYEGSKNMEKLTTVLREMDKLSHYTFIEKNENDTYTVRFTIRIKPGQELEDIYTFVQKYPYVKTISK